MRLSFIDSLCEQAEKDERIWLLCGDLGYSVLEKFIERFPGRFINVGVAEQNMIGVAAGLALSGKVVFVYSIANFVTMRCLEQIRNDVGYHNLDVKIVGVGGGVAYGSAGYTHHALEDLAAMRLMPNMTVIAPGDPQEARLATAALATTPGPAYLRLGKAGERSVHTDLHAFRIGEAIPVRTEGDVTLISTGGTLSLAMQAHEALAAQGVAARVLSMPTFSPLDRAAILKVATETSHVITLEDHGLGGLGSAVAEVLAEASLPVRFTPLRIRGITSDTVGSQAAIHAAHGLSVSGILQAVESYRTREEPPGAAIRTVRTQEDLPVAKNAKESR